MHYASWTNRAVAPSIAVHLIWSSLLRNSFAYKNQTIARDTVARDSGSLTPREPDRNAYTPHPHRPDGQKGVETEGAERTRMKAPGWWEGKTTRKQRKNKPCGGSSIWKHKKRRTRRREMLKNENRCVTEMFLRAGLSLKILRIWVPIHE